MAEGPTMSGIPPGKQGQPPLWIGVSPGPPDRGPTTPPPSTKSRQKPDHRLRGLDLGLPTETPVGPTRSDQARRRRRRRLLIRWVVVLVVAALVAVLLRVSVIEPFSVPSAAMAPTLHTGDRILVVKTRLLTGPVTRGNIVVLHLASLFPCTAGGDDVQDLVRRVIGLPGETISSVGDTIDINGRPLREPGWYERASGQLGYKPIHRMAIPPDHYFVMGDSRANSCDSRSFGAVPASDIVGKVVAVVAHDGHPQLHLL
jgi:signal peptidase I